MESVMTNQEPIDPQSYEMSKIEQVFYDWWETRGQSLVGDFSPQEAAFTAFKYGIYQQAKGIFDEVPTDDEITTLSYEFSDEVETGDDYFMTVVDPVGFARAVLERWGRQEADSTV